MPRQHHTIRTRPAIAFGCLIAAGLLPGGCATKEIRLLDARSRGQAAMLEERYEDAVKYFEAYLADRPARADVLFDLARAYEGMQEISAAREAYTIAYELEPDNPEYIEALAHAMAANGEPDAAINLLEQIATESLRAEAYLRLGRFLLDSGLADEAVQTMKTAAALDPSADPYRALAEAYRKFGDPDRELEALRHVLWFDPDDENAKARVRTLGGVPGPTFARPPLETDLPTP